MLEPSLQRLSPLGTRDMDAPMLIVDRDGLRVVEELFLSIWSVRASRKSADMTALLAQCARIEPRAWLAIGREPTEASGVEGVQITDVAQRYASFRISGPGAQDLFDAALSTSPTSGRCLRARFAEECEVFVQPLGAAEYRLLIDAPLAHFAAQWMRDYAG